jgi:hypothetical protein
LSPPNVSVDPVFKQYKDLAPRVLRRSFYFILRDQSYITTNNNVYLQGLQVVLSVFASVNLEREFGTHSGTFNKRWPLAIDTDKLKFTKFPNDMLHNVFETAKRTAGNDGTAVSYKGYPGQRGERI